MLTHLYNQKESMKAKTLAHEKASKETALKGMLPKAKALRFMWLNSKLSIDCTIYEVYVINILHGAHSVSLQTALRCCITLRQPDNESILKCLSL